jgi:hypothetical protein
MRAALHFALIMLLVTGLVMAVAAIIDWLRDR